MDRQLSGEDVAHWLGLDELYARLATRLDRIERRLDSLNITPADLDSLEKSKATLDAADAAIDAIEPHKDRLK